EAWVEEAIGNVLATGVLPADERLLRMLRSRLDLIPQSLRFRSIRRAVRALGDAEEDEHVDLATPALAPGWEHFHLTRGKRAVMVGGAVREDARQRLQAAFELAELEWENGSRVRAVQGIAE